MSLYDKRDDFPFRVQNNPHLDSIVQCMPMYGVYISQLLRFARACDRYSDFLARHKACCEYYLTRVFNMASSAENSNSFADPTISLFPLCDAASAGGCRQSGSVMAHLHSAGCCSGDWHRPIINLPFHWCPLGFFLLPFFIQISLKLIFFDLFFIFFSFLFY